MLIVGAGWHGKKHGALMSNYYNGGYRLVDRDGVPCRVAPWVADLSPEARYVMHKPVFWEPDPDVLDEICEADIKARLK